MSAHWPRGPRGTTAGGKGRWTKGDSRSRRHCTLERRHRCGQQGWCESRRSLGRAWFPRQRRPPMWWLYRSQSVPLLALAGITQFPEDRQTLSFHSAEATAPSRSAWDSADCSALLQARLRASKPALKGQSPSICGPHSLNAWLHHGGRGHIWGKLCSQTQQQDWLHMQTWAVWLSEHSTVNPIHTTVEDPQTDLIRNN